MKAVILAAGEGRRMHPLTETQPKVMLPLANKPLMEHLLVAIREAGIREFVFIVGYHADTVYAHFGDGAKWGITIDYVNQRDQLGTGHAVKLSQDRVGDRFLLCNGDIIVRTEDLRKLTTAGQSSVGLFEVADTTGLGVVEIEDNDIVRFHEKVVSPPTRLANAGVYLLTADVFAAIDQTPRSPRGEYELPAALQLLIDQGRNVAAFRLASWLNITYPWDLLDANRNLLDQTLGDNLGTVEANVAMTGFVSIGRGTSIRSGTYISGPVIIGDECDIGPNAYLRPGTSIGDKCHIGAAVEIKNSIIMSGTNVPHLSYVGDSVIGGDCNLGAGTKIANLRLDKKEIAAGGVNTGRRKFGAVIGANVQTGINASINAGTLIGNGSFIGPGAVANGVILPGSRIY
jgi:bifunctional UDP-N-acetylglucosamine pyrophosphorylase/glucosamine-1-phosphate N-acetyltransferase